MLISNVNMPDPLEDTLNGPTCCVMSPDSKDVVRCECMRNVGYARLIGMSG